jgi:hypothetical protein
MLALAAPVPRQDNALGREGEDRVILRGFSPQPKPDSAELGGLRVNVVHLYKIGLRLSGPGYLKR